MWLHTTSGETTARSRQGDTPKKAVSACGKKWASLLNESKHERQHASESGTPGTRGKTTGPTSPTTAELTQ